MSFVSDLLNGKIEPMNDEPRHGKAYVWVTHIVGLLAGSARCEFAPWYKAHFRYQKRENPDFDMDAWTAEHDRVVLDRAAALRREGKIVTVEDNNKFTLKGESAILGGKSDIVTASPELFHVIDVKTVKEKEADHWQVKIYQYVYPRVIPNLRSKIVGTLEYGPRIVVVPPMTREEVSKFGDVMRMVGGDLDPPKSPSRAECERCDIASCPSRDTSSLLDGQTKDF